MRPKAYLLLKHALAWFALIHCEVFAGIGDIDSEGWTILEPSADSRLVYVSSSEGNDANDGLTPQTPKATIGAANILIRNNEPDWLMLKRGDTFPMPGLVRWKSGRSAEEPIVLTYYGDSGPRPIIKLTGILINWNGEVRNHTAIVGLDLYRAISDPDSPDFTNSGSGAALRFIPGPNNNSYNTLIEDCRFRFCELVVQGFGNDGFFLNNFHLRRNIVVNTWGHGSTNDGPNAQGMFIEGVRDLVIEENLFDHNGWSEVVEGALPNQYNHNIYMGHRNGGEIIVRGNVISRAAAHGIQLRSGGHAIMNAFIANAIGMNLGYSLPQPHYTGMTLANDNVFTDGRPQIPGDSTAPQTGAIWGLRKDLVNNNNVSASDNIVANILNNGGINMTPYSGMLPDQFGFGNFAWNWEINNYPETDPGWTDPTRNADSYASSLGLGNWQGFIDEASSRMLREMPYDFSAYAYINYIREGFNKAPVTPPWFPICDDVAVSGVNISADSIELSVDDVDTHRLSATVSPQDACDHSVLWSSEDIAVASVDERGVIIPHSEGTTVITVTTIDGQFTDSCEVTVTPSEHEGPVNVARDKTATADSHHNISAGAAAVVDGNYDLLNETRWVSANTAWPHWVEIDLGGPYTIDQIRFWTGGTAAYANPIQYLFQYKQGDQWVNILEKPDNTSSEVDESFSPVTVNSGIVRLYGTGGGDSLMRIFELEVYGVPVIAEEHAFITAVLAYPNGPENEYTSSWFGNFFHAENFVDWVAHQGLGWLHTGAVEDADDIWLWSYSLDSWIYTHAGYFPWLWSHAENNWLYYTSDTNGSGWIFSIETSSWSAVQ